MIELIVHISTTHTQGHKCQNTSYECVRLGLHQGDHSHTGRGLELILQCRVRPGLLVLCGGLCVLSFVYKGGLCQRMRHDFFLYCHSLLGLCDLLKAMLQPLGDVATLSHERRHLHRKQSMRSLSSTLHDFPRLCLGELQPTPFTDKYSPFLFLAPEADCL